MNSKAEIYAVATGTGSYIPPVVKANADFISNTFYNDDGTIIETEGQEIVDKSPTSMKDDVLKKIMSHLI